jgi:hypothetical protein
VFDSHPPFQHFYGPNGIVLHPSKYTTPSKHPKPIVGSYSRINLDDSKCMTYHQRYEPYTDESLGVNYLGLYKTWLQSSQAQWREPNFAATASMKLADANENAVKKGEAYYPQWRQYTDKCQDNSSARNQSKSAIVLRAYENYTWVCTVPVL